MMTKRISLILAILTGVICTAQVSIKTAMELRAAIYGNYNGSDLTANAENLDIENGYVEFRYWMTDEKQDSELDIIIGQARLYPNKDKTYLLGVTDFHSDEQCSRYKTAFYEVSGNGDTLFQLDNSKILPQLTWEDFLSESKSKSILEKYLHQIQQEYLDENATIEDVLNEVYDFHFEFQSDNKNLIAKLTTCDYIPRNLVEILEEDWNVIVSDFKRFDLKYNSKLKRFVIA
jgi:hypothetical protein